MNIQTNTNVYKVYLDVSGLQMIVHLQLNVNNCRQQLVKNQ